MSDESKIWFRPGRFLGYGWTPVTWQGWASVLGLGAVTFAGQKLLRTLLARAGVEPERQEKVAAAYAGLLGLAFVWFVYIKSGRQRAKWGRPDKSPSSD